MDIDTMDIDIIDIIDIIEIIDGTKYYILQSTKYYKVLNITKY